MDGYYMAKKGERVKAFHPAMFGVVKTGTVTQCRRSYAFIDFGVLLNGTQKVPWRHVVGPADE